MAANKYIFLFLLCFVAVVTKVVAQTDTTQKLIPVDSLNEASEMVSEPKKVDSVIRVHSPRKAAIRSAILPGLGQAYNKKYWKIPIVYAALGISGSVFVYNLREYRALRLAYKGMFEAAQNPPDSTNYFRIRPDLLPLDVNAIRSYRDEFRRNIDYSVLAFILLWGLNVVDATVDAHLKTFDVSPDLGFQFKIGTSDMARTHGVSLILAFK